MGKDLEDPDSFTGKVFKEGCETFYTQDRKPEDVKDEDLVVGKSVSCSNRKI